MAMDNRFSSVLTEELLQAAEQVCEAARVCGIASSNLYDGSSGACAGWELRWSAEERKKWLT
jgi:hypothetical protein